MTVAAAAVMAQIIPELLVAGILGPLLTLRRMQYPERFYFASGAVLAVIAEATCIWSILYATPLPASIVPFFISALIYLLFGIVQFPIVWATMSSKERKQAKRDRDKRRTRWARRAAERRIKRRARRTSKSRRAKNARQYQD